MKAFGISSRLSLVRTKSSSDEFKSVLPKAYKVSWPYADLFILSYKFSARQFAGRTQLLFGRKPLLIMTIPQILAVNLSDLGSVTWDVTYGQQVFGPDPILGSGTA
jgi:hypothetical protein